jgi:hypothetical protein
MRPLHWFLSIVLSVVSSYSIAECTDSKVVDLAQKGRSLSAIAKLCDMRIAEVREILESESGAEDDEDDEEVAQGMPSGSPVMPCGCWGYAATNATFPEPRCSSQVARARMCSSPCPMGGYAWRAVCR